VPFFCYGDMGVIKQCGILCLLCLSGIGDDEDLGLYDAEEPTIAPASQSPAPPEINPQQSPVNQTQAAHAQQQSQLIAQLRSPPQIPLQVLISISYTFVQKKNLLIP
jgi:hypothetical protein